jgi:pimeloyl-ACP methyl ester carboxylesterase
LAQSANTKFVDVNNTRIAYRRFGKPSKTPLVYLTHYRGSMDVTDPLLMNTIAQNREVILLDNTGIGHSGGTVPDTIDAMTATVVNLLAAINVPKADILGFSMGGLIAQVMAIDYPRVVNKLILAGSRPGYGPDIFQLASDPLAGPAGDPDLQPTKDDLLALFFYPSDSSRAKGDLWWDRVSERQVAGEERKGLLSGAGVTAQIAAITAFASDPERYAQLANITVPVHVTNGRTDILFATGNSFILQQRLPDAQLHIYPDSAHGHLFQFPVEYAIEVEQFLDRQ